MCQLVELTERILHSAEQKDWEALAEGQQQRRALLEIFFQQTVTDHEAPHVEEMIRQMMALDKKITALAEAGKLEVLRKMRNLSAGQLAIDAYTNNSR